MAMRRVQTVTNRPERVIDPDQVNRRTSGTIGIAANISFGIGKKPCRCAELSTSRCLSIEKLTIPGLRGHYFRAPASEPALDTTPPHHACGRCPWTQRTFRVGSDQSKPDQASSTAVRATPSRQPARPGNWIWPRDTTGQGVRDWYLRIRIFAGKTWRSGHTRLIAVLTPTMAANGCELPLRDPLKP